MNKNKIKDVLLSLSQQGITFALKKENVSLEGNLELLTPETKLFLKQHKQAIIEFIKTRKHQQRVNVDIQINKAPSAEVIQLSFAQQRLWFIDKLEQGSSEYNIPSVFRLEGNFDKHAFYYAVKTIITRHKILAASLKEENGKIYQLNQNKMDNQLSLPVTEIDLSEIEPQIQQQQVTELVQQDINTSFDLNAAWLIRIKLIILNNKEHIILFNMHHIIFDGWSSRILNNEFSQLYSAFTEGKAHQLTPLKLQYTDYAFWQRNWLQGEVLVSQMEYWKKQLTDIPPLHSLLIDTPSRTRPAKQSFVGQTINSTIDKQISQQIGHLCQRYNVTLFMFMQTAFAILLARYSNETDIVMGTPVSGRVHQDIEPLIGCFLNTLVLRSNLTTNPQFTELLDNNKNMLLDALNHQHIPFEMLVDQLQPERSLSHSPLFQIFFTLQQAEKPSPSQLTDLTLTPVEHTVTSTKFDLSLVINQQATGLELSWSYNCSLFNQLSIERLVDNFSTLLASISEDPSQRIQNLQLLSSQEEVAVLNYSQAKLANQDSRFCLHQSFEKIAARKPQHLAIKSFHSGKQLNYRQLNQQANQLAHGLIARGIKTDSLVGIYLDRSPTLLVAILAILKSGAAYVPIDPNYPVKRNQYILKNSEVDIVISQTNLAKNMMPCEQTWLCLDEQQTKTELSRLKKQNPILEKLTPSNLAYLIYTSGSTGQPKGVSIEHQNASAMLNWAIHQYTKQELALVAATTSICFDLSIFELFAPLTSGGSILLMQDGLALADVNQLEKITLINTVPSVIKALINLKGIPPSVKVVNLAGEPLARKLVDSLYQTTSVERVFNLYGPSEDTTYSTVGIIPPDDPQFPDIGRPLPGTFAYVLNKQQQLVGIGMVGELYLGGSGVSRGYFNQPEMTRHKFIDNPFSHHNAPRLYKTGDLVRWLSNGKLEFIGRQDQQIKIRGFRIEPAEIESNLSNLADIDDITVQAISIKQTSQLVAYIATHLYPLPVEQQNLLTERLSKTLKTVLPDYMIPGYFIYLDKLPLTSNGKIDLKSLPQPTLKGESSSYLAASTSIEKKLCLIWQKVLNIPRVAINQNFFSLGGDSIISIQTVAQAKQHGLYFSVRQLFEHQTIEQLATVVTTERKNPAAQNAIEGKIELLPIQQDFFALKLAQPQHYNQAVLLTTPAELSLDQLKQMIAALYQRHDALRLSFHCDTRADSENHQMQWNASFQSYNNKMLNQSVIQQSAKDKEQLLELINHHQASFSFSDTPLFKAVWFAGYDKNSNSGRLLLVSHHLLVDGVSWRIILSDLQIAWQQLKNRSSIKLPAKTHSLVQWSTALKALSDTRFFYQEKTYWLNQWSGINKLMPVKINSNSKIDHLVIGINKAQTNALLHQCHSSYNTTIQEILLAALLSANYDYFGHDSLVVELEGHGREESLLPKNNLLDITETVGWFTSLYPLALKLANKTSSNKDLAGLIKNVKESIRSIPNKGLGYAVLKYLAKDKQINEAEDRQNSLLFNYLGQFDNSGSPLQEFTTAVESLGQVSSSANGQIHLLAFNGLISDGQLQFSISFNQHRISKKQVEQFASLWQQAIQACVTHCIKAENCPTPSDFNNADISLTQLENLQQHYPELEQLYLATPMQCGLLFHGLYHNDSQDQGPEYNTQTYMNICGALDISIFNRAWEHILQRYDILRTCFVGFEEAKIHQLVETKVELTITLQDWRQQGLNSVEQAQQLKLFRHQDKLKEFDFSSAPLMRFSLIQLNDENFHFVWTHHHVLLDGWCLPIIFEEMSQCYAAFEQNNYPNLAKVTSYQTYVEWLSKQSLSKARKFWSDHLSNLQPIHNLAEIMKPLAEFKNYTTENNLISGNDEFHQQVFTLDLSLTKQLEKLAQSEQSTLNVIIQAAWAILIGRCSGEQDIVFGSTISGRPAELPGVERMVGLFINTIPVRINLNQSQTLSELLNSIHHNNIIREENGYLALAEIAKTTGLSADNLFDSLVVFENFPVMHASTNSTLSISQQAGAIAIDKVGSDEQTNYSLNLVCHHQGSLKLTFGYQTNLYSDLTIKKIASLFKTLLTNFIGDKQNQALSQLSIVSTQEMEQLHQWGTARIEYKKQHTIHQLFEKQVLKRAQNIAVTFKHQSISYQSLNQQANRLAHYLIEQGVTTGSLIGLHFDRCLDMLIGMLAILKTGSGYLPLDPILPQQRLNYMLDDSGVKLVLSQQNNGNIFSQQTICLDSTALKKCLTSFSENNPQINPLTSNLQSSSLSSYNSLSCNNVAYVIYTSGSTGEPKGVQIEHHNVVRLLQACEQEYATIDQKFSEADVWTMFHSYGFDFSVWEIWGALTYGGRLVIVPNETTHSPQLFLQLLAKEQVTILNQTPSAFYPLISTIIENPSIKLSLRNVIFGGEALNFSLLAQWFKANLAENCQLINMYGITETTIHATFMPITKKDCMPGNPNINKSLIGKPLADLSILICDQQLQQQPFGIAGELLIAGDGVARNYLNRAKLTSQRFIEIDGVSVKRYYRTGDLVRYCADGQLEYIGRIDNQVKIRGFRIELGEIEARLSKIDLVANAAVLLTNKGNAKRLVAYIVCNQDIKQQQKQQTIEQIKFELSNSLADYMIPEIYRFLTNMPITENGKIDRKSLPTLLDSDIQIQKFIAPKNQVELTLAKIWQEVLQMGKVGANDNFFSLGGDSIISIQVVARAKKAGYRLTVRNLFENPTIASLAPLVNSRKLNIIAQEAVQGKQLLLPIHHHFFQQQLPSPHHFNQSVLLSTPKQLTENNLNQIIAALYSRHDALRLRFNHSTPEPTADYESLSQQLVDNTLTISFVSEEQAFIRECEQHQASLNFSNGPLFKVIWFNPANKNARLLLILHHLIVDGIGWRILLTDIELAWQQLCMNKTVIFASKTHSIQHWAKRLVEYSGSKVLRNELTYWQQQFAGNISSLTDIKNTSKTSQLKSCSFSLDKKQTSQLLGESNLVYRTQINELLLAALALANKKWRNNDQLILEIEGHGREELFDDLELNETLGWFTSIYPLRLKVEVNRATTIKSIKEQIRCLPNKGIGYGLLRYLAGEKTLSVDLSDKTILFNYLGQFDNTLNLHKAFAPADEYSGLVTAKNNPPSHLITLNGLVTDGKLKFNLNYDNSRITDDKAHSLLNHYQNELFAIIEHCQDSKPSFTPSDFLNAKITVQELESLEKQYPQLERLYVCSPMQQGLLFHGLLENNDQSDQTGNGSEYTTQTLVEFKAELDIEILKEAWQSVIQRHDILRTCFVGFDQQTIHQLVSRQVELPFIFLDWRAANEPSQDLNSFLQEDKNRGFDFSSAPLMRITLIQLTEQHYQMIWSHHHSLLDGWCLPLLFNQVTLCYQAFSQGSIPDLPTVPKYENYISWLIKQQADKARLFWKQHLSGFSSPLPLTKQPTLSLTKDYHCYRQTDFNLNPQVTQQLISISRDSQSTMNVIVQAAWSYLLHRYSGDNDIIFGSIVSGRPAELDGIEQMVGLFINTLPVRTKFNTTMTIAELIQQLHQSNLSREEHSYISLAEIQKLSPLIHTTSLFDSILIFENYPIAEAISGSETEKGLDIVKVDSKEQTNYPITLIAHLVGDSLPKRSAGMAQLSIKLGYYENLFDQAFIERLIGHLSTILTDIAKQGLAARLNELSMLSSAEQIQINNWSQYNKTTTKTDLQLVHHFFEKQVTLQPENIALQFKQEFLSYEELNQQANQLAQLILTQKETSGSHLVGIYLNRSCKTIVAMLAILKAGCAYLPLDPDYPESRINFMLDDAAISLLISETAVINKLSSPSLKLIILDDKQTQQLLKTQLTENPTIDSTFASENYASSLAYVIYTSGSTGEPKGVCIQHKNIIALIEWAQHQYSMEELAVIGAVTSISFDLSVFEIFVALSSGSQIALLDNGLDLEGLKQASNITLFNTVPSVMKQLIEEELLPKRVKVVNLAGEPLSQKLVDHIYQKTSVSLVYNLYGPSEDTVYSTATICKANQSGNPSIGRRIAGSVTHVLDQQLRPLPIGVAGELHLGGLSVSCGYLNRKAMTEQRFIANPFSPDSRLYKTGDRVRWLINGELEFLGRKDNQVKLRGIRIELGEIESCLSQITRIKDNAVVIKQNGPSQQLIAFIVLQKPASNLTELVEQFNVRVKLILPINMQPERFVFIKQLPLTPNGKIDRLALVNYSLDPINPNKKIITPKSATEHKLCNIWQQALKIEKVSLDDNFFELGGDSIISIQVVSRARRDGLSFSVRELFDNQTIAELSTMLKQKEQSDIHNKASQKPIEGNLHLLPIQLDFFAQEFSQPNHYNQALLLSTPVELNIDRLSDIIKALYARHDSLRLSFTNQKKELYKGHFNSLNDSLFNQIINHQVVESIEPQQLLKSYNKFQASLNLSSGDIFKILFVQSQQGKGRLFFVIHHLAIDGVSWRILLSDLNLAWQQLTRGQKITLAPKTHSIQQWSDFLYSNEISKMLTAQVEYWRKQVNPVSQQFIKHSNPSALFSSHSIRLTQQQTQQLIKQCHRAYRSQINELLLSALLKAYIQWSGKQDLQIALETHGRNQFDFDDPLNQLDLSETLGWFTNLFPLLLNSESTDWKDIICNVKEQYRAIPDKGTGYGVIKYILQEPRLQTSQLSEAILFNYLGQLDNLVTDEDEFIPVNEPSGMASSLNNHQRQALSFNGSIIGGCLGFDLHFDNKRIEKDNAVRLIQLFQQSLVECINHCIHAKSKFTQSDFNNARLSRIKIDQLQQQYRHLEKLYIATPMQKGMLFHTLLSQQDNQSYGTGYINQTYCGFKGDLDINAFKQAWQLIVDQHDVFRTCFTGLDSNNIHQLVQTKITLPFIVEDWRAERHKQKQLSQYRLNDKNRGFDLTQAPLMRLSLIQLTNESFHFIWTFHHVLFDGWSMPRIFQQVISNYQALANDQQPQLKSVECYENYIAWLLKQDQHKAIQFWQRQLEGFDSPSPFNSLMQKHQHEEDNAEYNLLEGFLSLDISYQLNELARQCRSTLNCIIQAAWICLINRYTGETDIIFGSTVSGRPSELSGVEEMIGLFINTIPVRINLNQVNTVVEILQQLNHDYILREENSFISLSEIQQLSQLSPGTTLFDSILAFENYPLDESVNRIHNSEHYKKGQFNTQYVSSDEETTFPLSLMSYLAEVEQGHQLTLKLGYYSNQFKSDFITRLFNHFQQLLQAFALAKPQSSIANLSMLTENELGNLTKSIGRNQQTYPEDTCIHQLFEQQVIKTPNNIAVIDEAQKLTYLQLNQRANQLADRLLQLGVTKDSFVGLYLQRSQDAIIAILGVLKAGAAYVPFDPDYPEERLSFMLADSAVDIIVSHKKQTIQAAFNDKKLLLIDQLDTNLNQHNPKVTGLTSRHLAYMIYTSGTTGIPKGVTLEHQGLVNVALAQQKILEVKQNNRMLLFASLNFDASIIEIVVPLITGAASVIVNSEAVRSSDLLSQIVKQHGVTHATLPPAILPFLETSDFTSVTDLVVAGESCPLIQAKRWSAGRNLYNGYGPTEVTIGFSMGQYNAGKVFDIGKPFINKFGYIVDPLMRLVPQGISGELLVGGVGIARGYHNQKTLSAEKFIDNPFIKDPNRLYRTGDLVRQLSNGNFEFIGRIDNQIKIRGHRVELGEIETRLLECPQIKEAVVTATNIDNNKQLVSYIVKDDDYSNTRKIEIWPSVAEFYIYDELLYRAMSEDTDRITAFNGAISNAVKNKVVLEVGPGVDLTLTLMCVKAGAKKIYAVELIQQTYLAAKKRLAELGLQNRVILIHGDATKIALPEKVDYCVSGIVGSIGGSEGAAKIINEIRHHLKKPENMIPQRTLTRIAAITLPDKDFTCNDGTNCNNEIESEDTYAFSKIAAHYTEKIFSVSGHPFDLRLCLKNFPLHKIISDQAIFEELDHRNYVNLENQHDISLTFQTDSLFNGFITWLNLYTDADHMLDILGANKSLLPIYMPISITGISVQKGDRFNGRIKRSMHENGINPNYYITGELIGANGKRQPISFNSYHKAKVFRDSDFYRKLFTGNSANILKEDQQLSIDEILNRQLGKKLPSYMLPSTYICLDKIPLTYNGKIDFKALPGVEKKQITSGAYQAPQGPIEETLCEIWQQALRIEKIGVNDNFFTLGGDSIVAIQVIARARNEKLSLTVSQLFEHKTIALLAPLVEQAILSIQASQQVVEGTMKLLPIQQHFFELKLTEQHHFNQSILLQTPLEFNLSHLYDITAAIYRRHDGLRLIFNLNDGNWTGEYQKLTRQMIKTSIYHETLPEDQTLQKDFIIKTCNDWQTKFSIEKGPLMRAVWFSDLTGNSGRLLFIFHHLVIDGISWRIILSDLALLWQQIKNNQSPILPAKTTSIKQWRDCLDKYQVANASIDTNKETDYWLNQLSYPITQQIKNQHLQPLSIKQPERLQSCQLNLTTKQTLKIIGHCNEAYLTGINELLITSLLRAWQQWTDEDSLRLEMESHGREELFDAIDISETVGWFTAYYPQIIHTPHRLEIGEQLKLVKEQYRALPNKGIGFGILKYIKQIPQLIALDKNNSNASVVFNYLGQFDNSLADDQAFASAPEATGYNSSIEQQQRQLLAINGMVTQGELSFSITFLKSRIDIFEVENLTSLFKHALIDLISHCEDKITQIRLFEESSSLIINPEDVTAEEGIEI